MVKPTKEQLQLIKEVTQSNSDKFEVVYYRVADNLIYRDFSKFSLQTLYQLTPLLVGKPLTFDHKLDCVTNASGIIFASKLVRHTSIPPDVELDVNNRSQHNQEIIDSEGYVGLYCAVAIPSASEYINQFLTGVYKYVSVGGYRVRQYLCPLDGLNVLDEKCNHLIPTVALEWEGVDDNEVMMPYFIKEGLADNDLFELSVLLLPNCPNAKFQSQEDELF